jgi:hypothetical protein
VKLLVVLWGVAAAFAAFACGDWILAATSCVFAAACWVFDVWITRRG